MLATYMHRISSVISDNDAVKRNQPRVIELDLELIPRLKHLLQLVLLEDEGPQRPQIGRHIIDFDLKGRDDAKVLSSAAQAPEQIGILRGRGRDGGAVGENNTRGDEVVGGKAVAALEEAVSASEKGADGGDALADTGDYVIVLAFIHS